MTTRLRTEPARTRPPADTNPSLHERLPGWWWSQLKTALTVTVLVLSTVLAVVVALRAPSVSPVAPPVDAAAAGVPAPGPGTGLLNMIGGFGPDRAGRGAGRGR